MSAKGLMSLAVVVVSTVAGAETYTWTGAENGFWTNAANWTVGGEVATKCPGVCSNEIFAAVAPRVRGDCPRHAADGRLPRSRHEQMEVCPLRQDSQARPRVRCGADRSLNIRPRRLVC